MKKTTRIIFLLLTIILIFSVLPINAFAAQTDSQDTAITYTISKSSKRASVKSCSATATGDILIPYVTSDICNVISIESKAFSSCNIDSVYIPSSVVTIAEDAFDANSEIIIKCTKYSAAYQYAVAKDMSYVLTPDGNDNSVSMDEFSPTNSDRYTGNQGDTYLAPYKIHESISCVSKETYDRGLVAWLARWNFGDKKCWVWNEYEIDKEFSSLTGSIDIGSTSYNKSNFSSTIQIIGDGSILKEYTITQNSDYPIALDVDVSNVEVLKINIYDNIETAGGTFVVLGNLALSCLEHTDVIKQTYLSYKMYESHIIPNTVICELVVKGAYSLGTGFIYLKEYSTDKIVASISTSKIPTYETDDSIQTDNNYLFYWSEDNSTSIGILFYNVPPNTKLYTSIDTGFLISRDTGSDLTLFPSKEQLNISTSIDRWNFLNNSDFYADTYLLNGDDADKFNKQLSYFERVKIKKALNEKWGGSCYGMSLSVILNNMMRITPDLFYGNMEYLCEIPKTKGDYVEGKINYFHMLQWTNAALSYERDFTMFNTKTQLEIIDLLGEQANADKTPFLISFNGTTIKKNDDGGKKTKLDDFGHTVVGVKKESGDYTREVNVYNKEPKTVTFDSRILIYDCSCSFSQWQYLYYNKGSGEWYMESWDNGITSFCTKLTSATNNPSILDPLGNTRSRAAQVQSGDLKMITITADDSNFDFELTLDDQTYRITSETDLRELGLISFFDNNLTLDENGDIIPEKSMNVFLPDDVESYSIRPTTEKAADFAMYIDDMAVVVQSDAAENIAFDGDGNLDITGMDGDYSIDLVFNEGCNQLPWNSTNFSGEGASQFSIEQTEEGAIVSGDVMDEIRIIMEDSNNKTALEFSTEQSSVLLTGQDSGVGNEPVLKLDQNNDGIFETTSELYTVKFQPNSGTGSMIDTLYVPGEYGIPDCTFIAPEGKVFKGWSEEDDGEIIIDGVFRVEKDMTLYAVREDLVTDTNISSSSINLTLHGNTECTVIAAVYDSNDRMLACASQFVSENAGNIVFMTDAYNVADAAFVKVFFLDDNHLPLRSCILVSLAE